MAYIVTSETSLSSATFVLALSTNTKDIRFEKNGVLSGLIATKGIEV